MDQISYRAIFKAAVALMAIEATKFLPPNIGWQDYLIISISIGMMIYAGYGHFIITPGYRFYKGRILISLREAVLKIYDSDCPAIKNIEALGPNNLQQGRDMRLIHIAGLLIGENQIYGFKPMGKKLKELTMKDYSTFSESCKSAVDNGGSVLYRNLKIDLSVLRKYLKYNDK